MSASLYEDWFQSLPFAAIFVTSSLAILSANVFAESLLAEGDAILRRAGVLSASNKPDQAFLSQLADPLTPPQGIATFRSTSGLPLVLATIAPLAEDAPIAEGRSFCITAWRAKAVHERNLPDLRRLFGLTRSEASLVGPLLQARTPQDIAADLNLSVETVRSHLKNAYAKAGVTNRNAFISLLTALLP
ncbi:MAG TPA: helix-turn-helix transcriptional regulator [Caulobacteraceae bacterium]|jgi:DNA-binding CsgD family transcriptional regulator|nr:helix-turn-helix transcriptional regulator [Caulobacteraceae bacterium]